MKYINSWIPEEELPAKAGLKVIRKNDPNYGLTEDEIQDRNEFIRCYLMKEFESLLMIPKQEGEGDFFIHQGYVAEDENSAFNTVDFQRRLQPFNRYAYAIKKIMEHVKDLAIMHSSSTHLESRQSVLQKYETFVDSKFRDRLLNLVQQYRRARFEDRRYFLKQEIAKLNRKILECKEIWERYAPPESWDVES
jgi:hypothetical protein